MLSFTPQQIAQALYESLKDSRDRSETMDGFMKWLKQSGLWSSRASIISAFDSIEKKNQGIKHVRVVTARELDTDQQGKILATLKKNLDTDSIEAEWEVNDSLIGGIRLEFEGKVLDASLSTQVNKLSHTINS